MTNYTNVSSEVNFDSDDDPLIRDLNGLSEESLDFSSFVNVTDNLKITAEVLNITDESRIDRLDSVAARLDNIFGSGTQYYLGVQYTY